MNKTTRALKIADSAIALAKISTNRADDIRLYDEALAAIREALADHSVDANEMVMDWSKVKPEAINSDTLYQMGYAAAMSKFAAQFQSEPVKQEPVARYAHIKCDVCGLENPGIHDCIEPVDAKTIRAEADKELAELYEMALQQAKTIKKYQDKYGELK